MALTPNLSRAGRVYLGTVVLAGFGVVTLSVHHFYLDPIGYEWFLLAALTLLSGSASVHIPASNVTISISETFVFTAVLLYGPAAGTLIVALDALVMSFWIAKRRGEPFRILFNISAPAFSAWCASQLFFSFAGIAPLVHHTATLDQILPALVVFALSYFLLNSWLIAFAVAFERRVSAFSVWKADLLWLSLNYFCGASVAVLIVVSNGTISLGYLGVIIPLLLVLYFTFRTAMVRAEDAGKHLQQLNKLYLSTIETLAMAIDAKDQITHGHIRRVQGYAVGLARRLGMTDGDMIRAIEAAALLHDTGKLAVPEYILNKPGKLTPAEFEKMKLHATVGADILSAIEFPYPVVPIVRHHHENWDGTGYPSGLRGTDIPMGARILAVVDCFDALTSDRPYRPRLSNDEALAILFERRGTMYDPMIVDAFARAHAELSDEVEGRIQAGRALDEITNSAIAAHQPLVATRGCALDDITSSSGEMLALYELAAALAGQTSISDTGDVIAKHLKRLVPFSTCVLYLYDSGTDELVARHSVGELNSSVTGLRIALGQRLSGWVAANRHTIVNSDPSLDLGEVARHRNQRLRSCISTPLVWNDELVGVLTLYSTTSDGFTEDHQRIIEAIARQIAHTFHCAAEFDEMARRDPVTGLPSLQHFQHVLTCQPTQARDQYYSEATLVLFHIADFKYIVTTHGRETAHEILRHVAVQAQGCLRLADILFKYSEEDFILLANASDDAAQCLANDIKKVVENAPFTTATGTVVQVSLASAPIKLSQGTGTVEQAIKEARLYLDSRPQVRRHTSSFIH